MTRATLPLLCLLLAACGGRADVRGLYGDGARAPTVDPGPEPAPGFETTLANLEVRSPVVAVDPAGRTYVAAIVQPEGLPAFIDGDRVIPFPGAPRQAPAQHLAMVAGPNGQMHAAWTTEGGALYYGRVLPEASRLTAIRMLQAEAALKPNLAVSEDGEVFIAFVEGWYSREPRQHVATYRGTVERGFEGPERVMPDCCDTYTNDAWFVDIGSVRFDAAGLVHLAYTWRGNTGHTDYVALGRGWYLGRRIDDVATSAHAALVTDARGRGLVTVNEASTELRWSTAGARDVDQVLYEGVGLTIAHATVDQQGILHAVIHRLADDVAILEHLRFAAGGVQTEEIARGEPGEALWMTPSAGGMAFTDRGPIVPFIRSWGRAGSRLEVAAPAGAE